MIAGYITCFVVALIIIFIGYLIHIKKKLWLIAGYQEDCFIGNKDKLAKLFGVFSYIVGIITLLLPIGLKFWGQITASQMRPCSAAKRLIGRP